MGFGDKEDKRVPIYDTPADLVLPLIKELEESQRQNTLRLTAKLEDLEREFHGYKALTNNMGVANMGVAKPTKTCMVVASGKISGDLAIVRNNLLSAINWVRCRGWEPVLLLALWTDDFSENHNELAQMLKELKTPVAFDIIQVEDTITAPQPVGNPARMFLAHHLMHEWLFKEGNTSKRTDYCLRTRFDGFVRQFVPPPEAELDDAVYYTYTWCKHSTDNVGLAAYDNFWRVWNQPEVDHKYLSRVGHGTSTEAYLQLLIEDKGGTYAGATQHDLFLFKGTDSFLRSKGMRRFPQVEEEEFAHIWAKGCSHHARCPQFTPQQIALWQTEQLADSISRSCTEEASPPKESDLLQWQERHS
jgi:hypothetical protein